MNRAGPLAPVLAAMLRREPKERPTAAQARQALADVAAGRPVSKPGRTRRPAKAVVAAGALTVAALLVATILLLPSDPIEGTGSLASAERPDAGASGAPGGSGVATMGDPKTADPCALMDAEPLSRFGDAHVDADYGGFDRCDVLIGSDESEVDVKLAFSNPIPGEDKPANPPEVVRQQPDDGECERALILADGYRVFLTVQPTGDAPPDNLCEIADVAAATAVDVLRRGPVPRRPEPPDTASLQNVDACALLGPAIRDQLPELDLSEPDPAFGGWDCEWDASLDRSMTLRFDRHTPLSPGDDGQPVQIADRTAFVEPEAEGEETCVARVVHRSYIGHPDGAEAVELVLLTVEGPHPTDQLCATATDLARIVAARLPPA